MAKNADRQLQGHAWTPRTGVRPCLLCALQVREPPEIRARRIVHGQWALDYPLTAGIEVRVGKPSSRWGIRPAQVAYLYPPWLPYWERRSARRFPNGHEEIYLLFQGADALRPLVDRRAGHARFSDPDGVLGALLSKAARIGTLAGETGFWKAQAVLCSALDLLLKAPAAEDGVRRIGGADEAGPGGFARKVEECLRERLGERRTLAEIARRAGVSASTLTHRYRAETGRTPMQALRDLRLAAAKGLLVKGWKLQQIAAQTGFVDAFHLSKTFKRAVGVPPKAFLRTLRGRPARR